MEGVVRLIVVEPGGDVLLHRGTAAHELLLLLLVDPLCGERGDPRLDLDAQLIEILRQTELVRDIFKAQRIVHPAELLRHIGALAAADFQAVAGDEQLDRLLDRAAADIQALRQLELIGQLVPNADVALLDQIADLRRNLLGKRDLLLLLYRFE